MEQTHRAGSRRGGSTFGFTLGADRYTSAGVYDSNHDLVRTLWRRVYYLAGTYTNFPWDGKDDDGQPVPAGKYTIKLLAHDVTYAWDGVIGNSSATFLNVHRGTNSDNVLDLAFDGGRYIYEAFGFNEGDYDIRRFDIHQPQTPAHVIHNTYYTNYGLIATDGTLLYLANIGNPPDATHTTFVIAYKNSDFSQATFSSGSVVKLTQSNDSHDSQSYPSCIDVHSNGSAGRGYPSASGLAVQRAGVMPDGALRSEGGTILAVAHGDTVQSSDSVQRTVPGLDKIFLYDKISGRALGQIAIENPRRIAFDPVSGDLWIPGRR